MSNILISYPLQHKRRETITVKIGSLSSKHPLVLQSMLTSHTFRPEACLKEMQLLAVGCPLIRLAIPAKRDLAGMPEILD